MATLVEYIRQLIVYANTSMWPRYIKQAINTSTDACGTYAALLPEMRAMTAHLDPTLYTNQHYFTTMGLMAQVLSWFC